MAGRDRTPGERCRRPLVFPERPKNRPALPRIGYRIGTYSDFREHLVRKLDETTELSAWTHRQPDDPGIALLEGAAALGDVLTFYQELYANEAFLRTAGRRTSVAALVRLLGYRLAPGLGGRGTFAFEIKDGDPVTVPAGFSLQVELEGADEPAVFETLESLVAHPALSRFTLHRPLEQPELEGGTTDLWVRPRREGASVELEQDDRLLVAERNGSGELLGPQILVVEEVAGYHGATAIRIRGALQRSSPIRELAAFKLGRTFRHFGHNAPRQDVTIQGDRATATTVSHDRSLNLELPLDVAVDDFAAGGRVICTYRRRPKSRRERKARANPGDKTSASEQRLHVAEERGRSEVARSADFAPRTVIRRVTRVETESRRLGSLTGASTVLSLNKSLALQGGPTSADIRTFEVHEVLGRGMAARAKPVDAGVSSGKVFYFFGATDAATALDGRRVMLAPPSGDATVATARVEPDTPPVPHLTGAHRVTLDVELDYADFPQEPEEDAAVAVHGNVLDADQGKSEREAVVGSGDGRKTFQTFKLPKAPLTYHYAPADTPPQAPELEVLVAGREWKQVDSLYGRGPRAEVYIVREDADGDSWIQFGDGERFGARLPSGADNVVARFRTGHGAYGPLAEGAKVQPGRLDRLDKVRLPGVISGGAEAEEAESARVAAPGRVQSLARLVGLSDFESEAMAIAGVARASAVWRLRDGVPAVVVTVLMEAGREEEFAAVEDSLRTAARERGPDRFELDVVEGAFEYVLLEAEVTLAAGARESAVRAAVEAALGVERADGASASAGLFGLSRRRFGQREHGTRVTGVIQNVPGVAWTRLVSFQGLGTSDDAESLAPPTTKRLDPFVACPAERVLRLYDGAAASPFRLAFTAGAGGGGG